MLPLGYIIRRHDIPFHFYADDTQMYIPVKPENPTSISTLRNCWADIEHWMSANFLHLNSDKTEIHWLWPSLCPFCKYLKPSAETSVWYSTLASYKIVQNAAARPLRQTKKREHITLLLMSLHWLPVGFRTYFKILFINFKAHHGLSPDYIS